MFQPTHHWQEKVFLVLVIFNCLFGSVLASERNEMVENWLRTFFTFMSWINFKKRSHWPIRCINLIYTEGANFLMMTRRLGNNTVKERKLTNNLGN